MEASYWSPPTSAVHIKKKLPHASSFAMLKTLLISWNLGDFKL